MTTILIITVSVLTGALFLMYLVAAIALAKAADAMRTIEKMTGR